MRQYLRLSGIQSTAVNRPTIDITALDENLGPVPGWRFLLDPSEMNDDGVPLDRVSGDLTPPKDSGQSQPLPEAPFVGVSNFPGTDEPGIELEADGPHRSLFPQVAFPTDEWTVFSVLRLTTGPSGQILAAVVSGGPGETAEEGEYQPRLGFSADGLTTRINAYGATGDSSDMRRLSYTPSEPYLDRTVAMMWTFSTQDGLRIFENGQLVASDPEDRNALDTLTEPGEWRLFARLGALVGLTGILKIDLGRAEMAPFRRRVDRYLAQRYSL